MLLRLTTSSVSLSLVGRHITNIDCPFIDSKYAKFFHREPFMQSKMSMRPPNPNEIFNLTILGGCRIAGRREVGLVLTKEYQ